MFMFKTFKSHLYPNREQEKDARHLLSVLERAGWPRGATKGRDAAPSPYSTYLSPSHQNSGGSAPLLQHKEELARSVIVPSSRMKITEDDWLVALDLEPSNAQILSSSLDEGTLIVQPGLQEPGVVVDQEALQEILDLCDPEYAPIAQECARRSLPLPEVGVDIMANGRVVGNMVLQLVCQRRRYLTSPTSFGGGRLPACTLQSSTHFKRTLPLKAPFFSAFL